jgi:uncharacterized protein
MNRVDASALMAATDYNPGEEEKRLSVLSLMRSLRTLAQRVRRNRIDQGYLLLRAYAVARRREKSMERGPFRTTLRTAEALFRGLHVVVRKLSGNSARLPWFTDAEAARATRERDDLLLALAGRVHLDASGTKPHTGSLSRGCTICRDGNWGCNLINRLCTRDCFFCKRYHPSAVDFPSETENYIFTTPEDHVAFVRTFGVRGVGFSGGEPLLVPDRLLSHIGAMRKAFGRSIYLWMYTNGDLVSREIMTALRDAGLDEIRFNLSARDYDLAPLLIARQHIPAVTVEIPAIPEHFERLKTLLSELQTAGVDFLNLHQLCVRTQNRRVMSRRAYHLDCHTTLGVFESELCALRLLAYACERDLRLPINYCSSVYKWRFQGRGRRIRKARAVLEGFQEITDAGYIRVLRICGTAKSIFDLDQRLATDRCLPGLWKADPAHSALALHSSLMTCVDWSGLSLSIQYLEPGVRPRNPAYGLSQANLIPSHRAVKTIGRIGQADFERWWNRFIQKAAPADNEPPSPLLSALTPYEEPESGLPEVC